ncbi:MAG TPA: outer membrane beta-barrel protein, partial [Pirellulales bacterium]
VITQPITEDLRYVFHSDIADDSTGGVRAEWYSATQYLFLDLTEKLSVGVRQGWFRDDDGVRIFSNAANGAVGGVGTPGVSVGMPGNYWDLSFGNNYKFTDNIITRGEIRYTYSDAIGAGGVRPYDDGARGSQVVFGGDVIVRF